MKKLLLATLTVLISTFVFGQQWVNFANGASANRVNIGDLDIAGDSITIEALVSWHSVYNLPNIVSKHSTTFVNNYLFRTTGLELTTDTLGYKWLPNPIILCRDTVYHLAGTYDGDSMKYYVNGVEVSSVAWSGDFIPNNLNTTIGNRANGFNEQFLGSIDELRIWNVARTQTEITSNMYDLPNPTTQIGLLAYYKFDGNYTNLQGNTAWNGVPYGAQTSLIINPYFNGTVSNNFCNPVGIIENDNESIFKVYPNPNTGIFKLEFDKLIINGNIEVLNLFSKNLLNENISDESKKEISLNNICAGIYFVKVFDGEKYYCRKIIIEHD